MKNVPRVIAFARAAGESVVSVMGPSLTGPGFGALTEQHLRKFIRRELGKLAPSVVVIPTRRGFNVLAAEVAAKMGIRVVLVSREGFHFKGWSRPARKRLEALRKSVDVTFVGNFFELNAYAIDMSDVLFGMFGESAHQDDRLLTHAFKYAECQGKVVQNAWVQWGILEAARSVAARKAPVRVVSPMEVPQGAFVVDIDSSVFRSGFMSSPRRYEEWLRQQLADKTSGARKLLLQAWQAGKAGRQVTLVTLEPSDAIHGSVLQRFLMSHLVPTPG